MQFPGSVKQTAMGRAGLAVADPDRINFLNPAAAAFQEVTVVEAGARADVTQQATATASQTYNGSAVRYFSLGFPVMKNRMGAGLGIRPYSGAGYEAGFTDASNACTCGRVRNAYTGDGGLNTYYIGAGYAPFARRLARYQASAARDSLWAAGDTAAVQKQERRIRRLAGLSFGVNGYWLFGTLNRIRSVDFLDSASFLDTRIENSLTPAGVHLAAGVLYRLEGKDGRFFNLGLSVSPQAALRARRDVLWYTYLSNTSVFGYDVRDTVEFRDDEKGRVTLPLAWAAGLATGKKNKWTLAADVSSQNWSAYEAFGAPDTLENSFSAGAGFEIIPHYGGPKFAENIWYRAGVYYNSSYLQLNGRRIDDLGITLGFGIPVLKADHSRAYSPLYQQKAVIQFAVEAGRTGTTDDGLLEQRYVRFHLGVVFKELWFIKRKYD
jgi:hypothetical protein